MRICTDRGPWRGNQLADRRSGRTTSKLLLAILVLVLGGVAQAAPPDDLVVHRSRATGRATFVTGAAVDRTELVIVDPGWYGDPPRGARLSFHLVLQDRGSREQEAFFVDAHSGEILDRWSLTDRLINRQIHNAMGQNNLAD